MGDEHSLEYPSEAMSVVHQKHILVEVDTSRCMQEVEATIFLNAFIYLIFPCMDDSFSFFHRAIKHTK